MTGIYDVRAIDFVQGWSDTTDRTSSRTHNLMIFPERTKNAIRKNSFKIRSANLWNSLPEHVVRANNVNTFKNRLHKFWGSQELVGAYMKTARQKLK